MENLSSVAVMGAGAWGTALACILSAKGLDARLWARRPEQVEEMSSAGENSGYLPGVKLPRSLKLTADLAEALRGNPVVILAIPAQHLRSGLEEMAGLLPQSPILVCASKGIEIRGLCMLSQVADEARPGLAPRFFALSGPSFALEVGRGAPTAVALGSSDLSLGRELMRVLSTPRFRVYANPDLTGVQLGGAVKNVMAIAAGISDGLQFGHNARAGLITRGLAEMSRLGAAMGARPATFMGLSGLGDLVLTCTGDLSRNRQVGLRLGRGEKLEEIMGRRKSVAEGVKTAEAVHALGQRLSVSLPITDQVQEVLSRGKDPAEAVNDLMNRELKDED